MEAGTKVCSNGPSHMPDMAAMQQNMIKLCKKLENLFLWNQKANDLETLYAASSTQLLPGLFK